MSVIPCAFRVAAVVSMMKRAMRFERPMPTSVSSRMRAICRGRLLGRVDQRLGLGIFPLIFDLFARLPEEEIGADGGAKDGDDDGQIITRQIDVRKHQIAPTVSQGTPTTNTTPT
jgi:hypothetical protein